MQIRLMYMLIICIKVKIQFSATNRNRRFLYVTKYLDLTIVKSIRGS